MQYFVDKIDWHVVSYSELLKNYCPSSLLLWNGEQAIALILRGLCKKYNVPVLYLERGPLPCTLQIDGKGFNGTSTFASVYGEEISGLGLCCDLAENYLEGMIREKVTWWEQPESKHTNLREIYLSPG